MEHIKAGDSILYPQSICYTIWGSSQTYLVKKKVKRLTKTLIILENGERFKRSNGTSAASGKYTKIKPYDTTKDETAYYDTLDNKRDRLREIEQKLRNLNNLAEYTKFFGERYNEAELDNIDNILSKLLCTKLFKGEK